jgi:two-component system osmolarity sensor histidine kinase EnvZ
MRVFPRRLDSLFWRLLLMQLGLVGGLLMVFTGLLYAERNRTVATLYADLWAPELARAAGLTGTSGAQTQVLVSGMPPAHMRPLPSFAPRFAALRQRLLVHGLQVQDMQLSQQGPDAPTLWLQVRVSDGRLVWLGMPGRVVLPEWPRRLLIGLAIVATLTALASWVFTRRLTRPLEQLRQRMQSHAPGGMPTGKSVTSEGSPEIVAMDTAYSELLARLEQHQRERSLLLAGISHDLRSPLARIRMAAGLLPDAAGSTTRQDSIVRNVAVADQLIESFMDYVRSDTLAFQQTVDLAEIVRAVAARFERPSEQLQVIAPPALAWPDANALMVDRLVSNLLDNAFKHGRPPVILRLQGDEGQADLIVEDAGEGIKTEDVDRMQEAFSRGNEGRSVAGTGLGLAIVRQIALRLGGTLHFETKADRHSVQLSLRRRKSVA